MDDDPLNPQDHRATAIGLTLPFEIFDLISHFVEIKDIISLSHTSRVAQFKLFPLILTKYGVDTQPDVPAGSRQLTLKFTSSNVCDFLNVIYTAPPWFYQTYPIISIHYTYCFRVDSGNIVRHLLRLKSVIKRTKTLNHLIMDFSQSTYLFNQILIFPFDQTLCAVIALAADKGCTELEVTNLGSPCAFHLPEFAWRGFKSKAAARTLLDSFLTPWRATDASGSNSILTKINAVGSCGFPTNPDAWAKTLSLINSSTTLTSLSLDLNSEYREPALPLITVPSLQSFTLRKEFLDAHTFEDFLKRHPNIRVLDIWSSQIQSGDPTSRWDGWNAPRRPFIKLIHLKELRCSVELLSYFLQDLDTFPTIKKVTITRLLSCLPNSVLQQEMKKVESGLGRIPSLGLRINRDTYSVLKIDEILHPELIKKNINRLEFERYIWSRPVYLGEWASLPNVKYLKFLDSQNGDVSTVHLRPVLRYSKVVAVTIGDRVYDMEEVNRMVLT